MMSNNAIPAVVSADPADKVKALRSLKAEFDGLLGRGLTMRSPEVVEWYSRYLNVKDPSKVYSVDRATLEISSCVKN